MFTTSSANVTIVRITTWIMFYMPNYHELNKIALNILLTVCVVASDVQQRCDYKLSWDMVSQGDRISG